MAEMANGEATSSSFTLLGDQPYSGPDDPLGFKKAVEGIETLIIESNDSTPFTLGIEGSWGAGKSTLMTALRERLAKPPEEPSTENRPEITIAQFNAWTAEKGRVLEGFVKTVLSAVKPRHLRNALFKQRAIGLVRFGLSSAAGLVGQSRTVEKAWDAVAADPRARNELRDLVEETIKKWGKRESDRPRLLCVFVDDLDRCDPEVVLEVLEAMKLYLDVPGIVFIVGYDEDIVTEVVLGEKKYGEKTTARSYLEKFIQISYRIPRPEEAQSKTLIEELLKASGTEELLGETERSLVLDGSRANPRRIKRFINSFILVYELDHRWRKYPAQSLVRVLLLRMYFPEFARLLEDQDERDPVIEFLDYQAAWDVLSREDRGDEQRKKVDKALQDHELTPSAEAGKTDEQLLEMLKEHVPPESKALVERTDFINLVRSLSEDEDWEKLREEFSGGALVQIAPSEPEGRHYWQDVPLPGLNVLWVDDEMEQNLSLIEQMSGGGDKVVTAGTMEEMVSELEKARFDVLISDIARDGHPEEGFKALEWLRSAHPDLVPGAVIFFTARKTPVRIERATALGAEITTSSLNLLEFLVDVRRLRDAAKS